MKDNLLGKGRSLRRATQLAAALLAIAGVGAVGGCLNRPLEPNEPRTTSTIVEPFTQSSVDKIDLVLMLDNSRSMADKQQILAAAVPDLVKGLVLPKCLDDKGIPAAMQPTDPLAECPAGTKHEFPPVLDIHIGIVSSSLGGHGSDACSVTGDNSCGNGMNPSNNDASHLISRQDACGGALVATYKGMSGFLAWDPGQKLNPVGEKTIGAIAVDPVAGTVTTVTPGIVASLKDMVIGVGQIGCGYEASLEGWYRFLIDPEPYTSIVIDKMGKAVPTGNDDLLIKQRADFLRPSSLLAIIMLTDENDCSTKEYGQFYFMGQQRLPADPKKTFHLPRARQECIKNPNDPCCKSCGQGAGTCPADAMCMSSPTLSDAEDNINLRCWDNKRRFGIDFLYPIDRYTQGLTSLQVPNRAGDLVPNPIFTDLNPTDDDSNVRDASLVFLAGIVGVPWQLIARQDADGTPDLLAGLNEDMPPKAVGGFKNSDELNAKSNGGPSVWDKILGDPANYVPPTDPHMIESILPRAPLTVAGADPLNGHEYTIANSDDLQYACVFDLPKSRDCSDPKIVSCDCGTAGNDNPLCDKATTTLQVKAKGYPGTRELQTLKSIVGQGVVASICPKQVSNNMADDYGYRPAIGSIIDRLKVALKGKCLPRALTPDPKTGQVQCLIIESRVSSGACVCDAAKARREVQAEHTSAIAGIKATTTANKNWNCFCEINQTGDVTAGSTPDELSACQNDIGTSPVIMTGKDAGKNANGWCYVDATTSPSTGNPDIVKDCPATEKRIVRFVGNGGPQGGSTLFITCSGS